MDANDLQSYKEKGFLIFGRRIQQTLSTSTLIGHNLTSTAHQAVGDTSGFLKDRVLSLALNLTGPRNRTSYWCKQTNLVASCDLFANISYSLCKSNNSTSTRREITGGNRQTALLYEDMLDQTVNSFNHALPGVGVQSTDGHTYGSQNCNVAADNYRTSDRGSFVAVATDDVLSTQISHLNVSNGHVCSEPSSAFEQSGTTAPVPDSQLKVSATTSGCSFAANNNNNNNLSPTKRRCHASKP